MNAHTAETLLRCYRVGRPAGSRMQKAVRWAEGDPGARQKLEEQMQFDQQIVDAIHYVQPPENLRQKLGALSSKPEKKGGLRRQIINPGGLSALMGILVICAIIGFFIMEGLEKFPGRESVQQILTATGKMSGVDFEPVSTTTNQLGDWLFMRGYEGYEVPPEIASLPVVGSRVFRLDGKPIAQLAVDRHDSLVYEFHATDFGVQLPSGGDWRLMEQDAWAAAIRQQGDHCFMIVFRGTKPEMREFLRGLPHK